MASNKLNPYRGVLDSFQIAEGIRCVKINAARLLKDAELLYEAKRYPSASSLAILAIEEIGKLPILRRMALAHSPAEWKACWRDFSNHLAKALNWTVPFLINRSDLKTDENYQLFKDKQEPELLNSLKQIGLYIGCYGKAHWGEPEKAIEEENAHPAMHCARLVVFGSQPSEYDTPTALRQWAQHLAGCYSIDYSAGNDRVVQYLKEFSPHPERAIPPQVAFEFTSTVLYLSEREMPPSAA